LLGVAVRAMSSLPSCRHSYDAGLVVYCSSGLPWTGVARVATRPMRAS
jgi:hypothetical protein